MNVQGSQFGTPLSGVGHSASGSRASSAAQLFSEFKSAFQGSRITGVYAQTPAQSQAEAYRGR